jgi:lysophospholipid acyltransferase (LPLAT)-like uncharacterized protein
VRPARGSRLYRLQVSAAGLAGSLFLRALGRTWRVTTSGPDPFALERPLVGAIWHEGLFVAAWRWRDHGFAVPVSRSRDGDLIDAVLRRLGFADSPRGSSSRGASSVFRAMLRGTTRGQIVVVLPDGPLGPARVAKPGAVALASAMEAGLVPVAVAARPCLRFGSWDRTLLPFPFARVHCIYGAPLRLPKSADDAERQRWTAELGATLDALRAEAAREVGLPAEPAAIEEPGP